MPRACLRFLLTAALTCAPVVVSLSAADSTTLKLAFTFDDLPAHGPLPPGQTRLAITQAIVAALSAAGVPAVYGFINGSKLTGHPEDRAVLDAWRQAGLPLASHTWSHLSINEHSAAEFTADIVKNEPLLASLMPSGDWHWFRYPFLWEGDTLDKRHAVRAYLGDHHYRIAQVAMDFEDYLWNPPYARCVAAHDQPAIAELRRSYLATADQYLPLYRDMAHALYGRDIPYVLLMHVGAFDARMLPELIDLYRRRGFRFVTLEEAQNDPAYRDDPDLPLRYGGTLLEQMMAARHLTIPPNSKPYKELQSACPTP